MHAFFPLNNTFVKNYWADPLREGNIKHCVISGIWGKISSVRLLEVSAGEGG